MDEQLLDIFFVGLQSMICNQIRPHDPKELMRVMEIALDVEETLREEKRGGNRNSACYGRYQGGTGIIARRKMYNGNSGQVSSSLATNARKELSNSTRDVRTGGVAGEGSRNMGSRTLPYPEYVRRRKEGRGKMF